MSAEFAPILYRCTAGHFFTDSDYCVPADETPTAVLGFHCPTCIKEAAHSDGGELASDVDPESVAWLWKGRIPLGKLTIVDGNPGNGKSLLAVDLMGRVTRGMKMPDGTDSDIHGPAGVVYWTVEDGLADTIVPRLVAVDADRARILHRDVINERGPSTMPVMSRTPTVADVGVLAKDIRKVNARLVVIDPLSAHLPGKVNGHQDTDIRAALAPLQRLASDLGVAVVVIRHLNKSVGGEAIMRGGGSIGIIGAARSGLIVGPESDDEDALRVLAAVKTNLAKRPPSLRYAIEGIEGSPVITWHGVSSKSADDLVAMPTSHTEIDDAVAFIIERLEDGPSLDEGRAVGIGSRRYRTGHAATREGQARRRILPADDEKRLDLEASAI